MQLFIADYSIKGNGIIITDADILAQARKVLRLTAGDQFRIQDTKAGKTANTRYFCELQKYSGGLKDGELRMECNILEKQEYHDNEKPTTTMLIAMPNKWEKVELIVQKLCEIGIDNIIFRPAERSVIKVWNEKKEERLGKISKEAVEQSRGRHWPLVTFSKDIDEQIKNTKLFVFDKTNDVTLSETKGIHGHLDSSLRSEGHDKITGIIGPEGGLTPNDYKHFETANHEIRDLGDTILRMETAAIVGGWILKNC